MVKIKVILTSFTLFTDILFFISLNIFLQNLHMFLNPLAVGLFWVIPLLFIFVFFRFKFDQTNREPAILTGVYKVGGLFLTLYLPKLIFIVFHLLNIITRVIISGLVHIINLVFSKDFVSIDFYFFSYTGMIISVVLFLLLLYGMLIGRFQFKIEKVSMNFRKLPVSFNGLRIVQISDIHLGSWYRKEKKMEKVVRLINNLNPDLILFTGDLVNNFSEEAKGWTEILSRLQSKLGKYSILGNHDYGDYWDWASPDEKSDNMKLLYSMHKSMGFRLLLNESDVLKKDGHEIGIIGVENWGKPPFMQYGDLKKATENLKPVPFKILLSHDPSHWSAEIHEKTDIDLTLSGHTHGMQFGFKIGKFQWSPVKYIYKLWSGLYGNNGQYLYVNRGLGSLGFPGRVGMRPEITLIGLQNHTN